MLLVALDYCTRPCHGLVIFIPGLIVDEESSSISVAVYISSLVPFMRIVQRPNWRTELGMIIRALEIDITRAALSKPSQRQPVGRVRTRVHVSSS